MYNTGTVTTTANSTKLIGTNTKWKDNNSRVSAEQVILIQNGATIYINSIASIQSNTEITLSFPVPASVSNAPYQILTTMVNSVSDAANKIVAMNVANVQFSDILNRWATESGTITVTLPDGTTQQLRTAKEMDKQLDGKFDKTGGVITRDYEALALKNANKSKAVYIQFLNSDNSRRAYIGFGSDTSKGFSIANDDGGSKLTIENGRASLDGVGLMKVGDYGFGGSSAYENLDEQQTIAKFKQGITQIWRGNTEDTKFSFRYAANFLAQSSDTFFNITAGVSGAGAGKVRITSGILTQNPSSYRVADVYTTLNTTKDSNGNLKAASPIVKVFADHIETNDEAEGVEMERLGIGHYLIKGVVGFNADGAWGINNGFVIPQDHNGKNMVLIDYKVRPDGDIEVFVFHQQNADMPERFQNKRIKHFDEDGQPIYYENYEPCDVPESRWIDMRVEMPVNSIYNLKKAEAERLAKEEADRQAEEAKNAEIEAEEDI
ncbi:hypothetical protein [Providencia stuartii]|uniref:phage tail fiber protein n=1 Tax=Providencia stuartii TaxID=588 RepID=UPI00333B43A1